MEVIYTGLRKTADQVVSAALQEDVDVIGVSILSGAHLTVFKKLRDGLRAEGLDDVVVIGGGVIPDDDIAELKALGVDHVFTPGTPLAEIVAYLRDSVSALDRS
jgi:methylmalonyl-CoA mutase C-terminal domain/subunit